MRDTIHNIVSHITMTQHLYSQMMLKKLVKQCPLMLMENVHLLRQNQTKDDDDNEHQDEQQQANKKPELQMLK